jgi:hypothetical protein
MEICGERVRYKTRSLRSRVFQIAFDYLPPQFAMFVAVVLRGNAMNLFIRRDQRSSLMGKVVFQLDVRAELTAEESASIQRYRLGKTVLYTKGELTDRGAGLLGLASRLAFHAMNISISVDDLVNGKRVECKDIVEMLAVDEQIREAATTFKQVLNAAMHFGGEEAIEL